MGFWGSLLGGWFGAGNTAGASQADAARSRRSRANAKYDAADASPYNRKHWMQTDSLSADRANSPSVRKILRERVRYECQNNPYASGISLTLANDVVGAGPRFQALAKSENLNQVVEAIVLAWARETRFAEKLHTMRIAKCESGESFMVLQTNPKLKCKIKLDTNLIETDQVSDPSLNFQDDKNADGVILDDYGNVVEYRILKKHPGSVALSSEPMIIPADRMIHYFTPRRPGQHRGVPDLTPSVNTSADLRRLSKATLASAETAAQISGVMYTDASASEDEQGEPFEEIEIPANGLLTLPYGWKFAQIKAEQPTSGFKDVRREFISEIGRSVLMPLILVSGTSYESNFAAAKLDLLLYYRSVRCDQERMESRVVEPIFDAMLQEIRLVLTPELRAEFDAELLKNNGRFPHAWRWPTKEPADPVADARAAEILKKNRLMPDAEFHAGRGKDWKEVNTQLAAEKRDREEKGLPEPEGATASSSDPTLDENLSDEQTQDTNREETQNVA